MICNVNVEFHNDVLFLYYLENQRLLKLRGAAFVCQMFSCFQNELIGSVLHHKVESQSGLPGVGSACCDLHSARERYFPKCPCDCATSSGAMQQPGSELCFNGPQIWLTLHISFSLHIRLFPAGAFGKTLRFRLRLLYFSSEKD